MKQPFADALPFYILIIVILFLLLLFNWLGYRLKRYQVSRSPELDGEPGTIENSLLGLMALLLAFSFGMAASKFDARKQLIIQEANNIGTAILRCDLFDDSLRKVLHTNFSSYIDARAAYYETVNEAEIAQHLTAAQAIGGRIWNTLTIAARKPENHLACQLMIPAVNDVIDIVSTRENARISKVPPLILWMLLLLSLTSAFITGYNTKGKSRNLILVAGFALMTTLTLYLVIELDHPRKGFVNLNVAEKNITDLKLMLK